MRFILDTLKADANQYIGLSSGIGSEGKSLVIGTFEKTIDGVIGISERTASIGKGSQGS